jgi:hypothetical protein
MEPPNRSEERSEKGGFSSDSITMSKKGIEINVASAPVLEKV